MLHIGSLEHGVYNSVTQVPNNTCKSMSMYYYKQQIPGKLNSIPEATVIASEEAYM